MARMQEKFYYAYMMASKSRTLYTGVTSQFEMRVWQHKNGRFEGFSKTYQCTRLVWFERYGSIHEAIAREKQLKGWTRAKKIALIAKDNPTWVDLSEKWGQPRTTKAKAKAKAKTKTNKAGPSTRSARSG